MPAILGNRSEAAGAASSGNTGHRVHPRLRGRAPDKRTINLAAVNVKRIDWRAAVPSLLLVLLAVAAFGKFAVVDRLSAAAEARGEVSALQGRLDEDYEAIESFGEINDLYAHYTYSGMTPEELGRVDRVEMMEMLRRVVLPIAPVDSWTVSGNTLVLDIEGGTLLEINQIVQLLLEEEMVDYCTVTTAATTDPARGGEGGADAVAANVVVQLKNTAREVEP